MCRRALFTLSLLALLCGRGMAASDGPQVRAFVGQDLHMAGGELLSHQPEAGLHILAFRGGFSMSIGANRYSSDSAVVWLEAWRDEPGGSGIDYQARVYLEGNLGIEKAGLARTTEMGVKALDAGRAMALHFGVSGEVFATANKMEAADSRGLPLYGVGIKAVGQKNALEAPLAPARAKAGPEAPRPEAGKAAPAAEQEKAKFRYPINIAWPGEVAPVIEGPDANDVITIIGRFYIWHKYEQAGKMRLLELQGDNAVVFYLPQKDGADKEKVEATDVMARGDVKGIYLSGDVLMTEGSRTIRADELYYDFEQSRAIIDNAVMRSFDATEGMPVYVRAERLRQLARDKFAADNITLTSSEFYKPQISATASNVTITDTTIDDEQTGKSSKASYDAEMHDVRFKVYDRTFFYWPYVRSNLQRPDIPLKSGHVGQDKAWGTAIETEWYIARLLGFQEPEGVDSSLSLHYYSKRGFGTGAQVDYARENYFGRLLGYIIDDRGEDRLGRHDSRKHVKPPRELRGRFRWQHRQFLPYNWQLTSEISYISDENFLESYYRGEFYVGKEQETLVHFKRIEDNWGLSLLSKFRINDFVHTLEEVPSGAFHWTGESFWDDNLTFYSDNQASRLRQRYADSYSNPGSEQLFYFGTTRNEVDMPLTVGRAKIVPFVAATAAYEDRLGFYRELDGRITDSEDTVWFAETGVRASTQPYWRVYPGIRSRLLDLNGLRHVIRPHLTAVGYAENDSVIEQRDTLNVGISQRLQTKRGSGEKERVVDWMRLDMDVTWVNDSGDSSAGPDRFLWNRPLIPILNTYGPALQQGGLLYQRDRRGSSVYGPRRNSFTADYTWRLSDTTAILSDMNFDMQSGVVQQFNIGVTRLCWPNLSYYLGSRYLRRIRVLDEEGSNAFTFAVTYVLDPRYTVVISQQVDLDYGATVRSDITLIRRYHRIYWGLTFSADESLDEQGIVFSVWPQGVPELGIGPKRYMGLGGAAGY
ncbi:MAG: hypothetical protein JSU94_16415 [Phycisphaerales bacterium]|nr:MAG: hypothetical protein JSU94_16415 [Phycisphaerales bacterium]